MTTRSDVRAFAITTAAALGALVAGAVVITKYTPLPNLLRSPSGYLVGKQVDIPRYMYEKSNGTLVIFARASCSACTASRPYLERLLTDLRRYRATFRVITVGPIEGSPDFGMDMDVDASYRLSNNEIVRLDLEVIPTLVWIDGSGKILFAHSGVLTSDSVPALIEQLAVLAQRTVLPNGRPHRAS